MNTQEIIVGIVLMICIGWVVRRTILCIKRIRQENDPCEGCPCGCSNLRKTCPNEKK